MMVGSREGRGLSGQMIRYGFDESTDIELGRTRLESKLPEALA